MSNDWIIDVLADLKAAAKLNGMDATVACLEDASLVALAELSALQVRHQEKTLSQPAEVEHSASNVTPLFSKRTYA